MPTQKIPNVDFRLIPREYEGLWVVVRLGADQEVVAHGETPMEAMLRSAIDPDDPRYVLTGVPRPGIWAPMINAPQCFWKPD